MLSLSGTQHFRLLPGMGPKRFSLWEETFSIGYAAIGIAPIASLHPVSFLSEAQHNR